MSAGPLFTQKHYEHLEDQIARRRDLLDDRSMRAVVETMCAIFERDNPKFKRDRFAHVAAGHLYPRPVNQQENAS